MVFKFKKVGILFQLKIWESKKDCKNNTPRKKGFNLINFFIGNKIFLHKMI
jgi:hypothetical protein